VSISQSAQRFDGLVEQTIATLSDREKSGFTTLLHKKSEILRHYATAFEVLNEEQCAQVFGASSLTSRFAHRIVALNKQDALSASIKSVRASFVDPRVTLEMFSRLDGAPKETLIDFASEFVHFVAPERFALVSRWVWNPARGTGALSPVFGTGIVSMGFLEMNSALLGLRERLSVLGYGSPFDLDIVCAMAYAGMVIGTNQGSMSSGGFEALFPNVSVTALIILGLRRIARANT
jgi:hypothetical protein